MRTASVVRRLAALLSTALLAFGGAVASTAPAQADGTVGIAIAPADAHGKPDGRTRFSYKADPGQTVTDHVKVSNAGSTPLKITVFAADAYNDDKGDYALRDTKEKAKDAASWVTFDGKPRLTVTLAKGQSRVVPFTVTIPKNARPGDHPAGVLASATSTGQVTVERRVANRMYVRVSGDLQPVLTISSISGSYHSGLNPADGSVTVSATVTNNGNVALEGVVTLSGSTWFGIGTGQTVRSDLPEILPGNTTTVSYQLKGVPQVGYAVTTMLLQSGISGDAPDPGPLPVITRDVFVLALPWLVLAVLTLGVGGWFFLRWRRRRDEQRAREWAAYAAEEAPRTASGRDDATAAAGTLGPGGTGGVE